LETVELPDTVYFTDVEDGELKKMKPTKEALEESFDILEDESNQVKIKYIANQCDVL